MCYIAINYKPFASISDFNNSKIGIYNWVFDNLPRRKITIFGYFLCELDMLEIVYTRLIYKKGIIC